MRVFLLKLPGSPRRITSTHFIADGHWMPGEQKRVELNALHVSGEYLARSSQNSGFLVGDSPVYVAKKIASEKSFD